MPLPMQVGLANAVKQKRISDGPKMYLKQVFVCSAVSAAQQTMGSEYDTKNNM